MIDFFPQLDPEPDWPSVASTAPPVSRRRHHRRPSNHQPRAL
ncbi:hypothetical protein O7632_09780 [Solwaraspora sp. WMMD406]|nr:hypothetical protein [Solwaraspora sp. WMMD406]MDG4764390.1 hypothetical protein [Solwaraspora sp. WMMD406]